MRAAYIDMTDAEQFLSSGADLALLLQPDVCAPVRISLLAAPQSPSQHTGYPTLRSAEELEDTSTMTQQHSMGTTPGKA